MFGYVLNTNHATICIRTEIPDYSHLPDQEFNWAYTVYGDVKELIPTDVPQPLGKPVVLTTYVDANLYHDLITGRALTAVLHLINQTPFDWYCKRQATVETATFGSEFIAAKTAVDQVTDIRLTLRYLGIPSQGKTPCQDWLDRRHARCTRGSKTPYRPSPWESFPLHGR